MLDLSARAKYTKVLRHEFGHWVAARSQGYPVGGIRFSGTEAGASVELMPSVCSLADATSYIETRIIILFSGALAEALDKKMIDNEVAHALFASTAANDHAKIRELVRILTGIKHPGVTREVFQKHLTKIDQRLYDRATELVRRHRALIVDLAVYGISLMDEALGKGVLLNDLELPLGDLEQFKDLENRLNPEK